MWFHVLFLIYFRININKTICSHVSRTAGDDELTPHVVIPRVQWNATNIIKTSSSFTKVKKSCVVIWLKVNTISANPNSPLWNPCHCQTGESTSRVLIAVFSTIPGLFFYYIIIYVQVWVHATCLWLQIFRRGLKCQHLGVQYTSVLRVTTTLWLTEESRLYYGWFMTWSVWHFVFYSC